MRYRVQCQAMTTKGRRCRNKVTVLKDHRWCVHHREKHKDLEKRSSAFDFKKGKALYTATLSTVSAVGTVIKIIEFVIHHWPSISQHLTLITPTQENVYAQNMLNGFRKRGERPVSPWTVFVLEDWLRRLPPEVPSGDSQKVWRI